LILAEARAWRPPAAAADPEPAAEPELAADPEPAFPAAALVDPSELAELPQPANTNDVAASAAAATANLFRIMKYSSM
jgi:hypothetical protein